MSIVNRATRDGKSWANFGRSANRQRGSAICKNNRSVSELGAGSVLLSSLIDFFDSPKFEEWVDRGRREAEAAKAKEAAHVPDDEVTRLTAAVKSQEAKVEKVVSLLVDVGASDSLKARLQAEEAELRQPPAGPGQGRGRRASGGSHAQEGAERGPGSRSGAREGPSEGLPQGPEQSPRGARHRDLPGGPAAPRGRP